DVAREKVGALQRQQAGAQFDEVGRCAGLADGTVDRQRRGGRQRRDRQSGRVELNADGPLPIHDDVGVKSVSDGTGADDVVAADIDQGAFVVELGVDLGVGGGQAGTAEVEV